MRHGVRVGVDVGTVRVGLSCSDPAGLLESITTRVATTPQGRTRPLVQAATWLAVAAAVVVLSFAAFVLIRPATSNVGGPSPSPAPSASASTTSSTGIDRSARPIGPTGLDAPPLGAGSWASVAFTPAVEFTVPADRWSAGLDLPQQLFLRAHLPGAPAG